MPASLEIEPQSVYMTVGRAKKIVLLQDARGIVDESIPKRIPYGCRNAWDELGPIFVMPAGLEIEPQSVYVAIAGAKQVVLFHHAFRGVNESITKRPINRGGNTGN